MAPAPQPHTCHAVFCSFFFDDSKQDSSTTAAHIKRIIELLNKHSIMSDQLSTLRDNTDGCTEDYRCDTALYLLLMLLQDFYVIIDCDITIILLEIFKTCSSPRRAVCSYSLVCSENSLLIVGIGPILNKELELVFRSDRSDRTCVYSQVSGLHDKLYIKRKEKCTFFWILKCNAQCHSFCIQKCNKK